jgi:hypothetical protein
MCASTRQARLGHEVPGMRGLYAHAAPVRNAAVRRAGRPVVAVRRAAQHRAAQRSRRRMQRIRRGPGRVRAVTRITSGAAAQVLRRGGALAGPHAGRSRRVPAQ